MTLVLLEFCCLSVVAENVAGLRVELLVGLAVELFGIQHFADKVVFQKLVGWLIAYLIEYLTDYLIN